MKFLLLCLSFIVLCATSCTRTVTVKCIQSRLLIYGVGFNGTDFTGNYFRMARYKADAAFDSLVDSSTVYTSPAGNDTTMFETNITAGFDYKITLSRAGKEYRITNVTENGLLKETFTYSDGPFGGGKNYANICYDHIRSCDINGVTYYAAPGKVYYYGGDIVYLNK